MGTEAAIPPNAYAAWSSQKPVSYAFQLSYVR